MGLSHSPKIVTDGLVVCLDAANKRSYPGSGTTWTDLSGNGNNGTLVNGPIYNGDNLGSIGFDGLNDSATLPSLNFSNLSPWSLSCWVRINSQNSTYAGFLLRDPSSFNPGATSTTFAVYYTSTFVMFRTNDVRGGVTRPSNGQIFNYVLTHDGLGGIKIYLDSILIRERTLFGDCSGTLSLGTGGERGNVNIYNFLKYDKEISQEEIKQNFNALRGRYGI